MTNKIWPKTQRVASFYLQMSLLMLIMLWRIAYTAMQLTLPAAEFKSK